MLLCRSAQTGNAWQKLWLRRSKPAHFLSALFKAFQPALVLSHPNSGRATAHSALLADSDRSEPCCCKQSSWCKHTALVVPGLSVPHHTAAVVVTQVCSCLGYCAKFLGCWNACHQSRIWRYLALARSFGGKFSSLLERSTHQGSPGPIRSVG